MYHMGRLLVKSSRGNSYVMGKFQISEVDPWTRTPILVDTGTFAIHLSMYVLIETHIKGVPIPRSDTDSGIRIGYI